MVAWVSDGAFMLPVCLAGRRLMMKFLTRLCKFADNPYVQVIVAVVLIVTSVSEAWDTLADDLSGGRMRASHGTLLLGIVGLMQSLPDLVEGLEAVSKVTDKKVGDEIRKLEDRSE